MARLVVVARPTPTVWRALNATSILAAPVEMGLQVPGLGAASAGVSGRGVGRKVAAQGGRLAFGVATFPTPSPPGTAGGPFTYVAVTRDYDLATGAAPTGTVTFTPSAWLVNNGVTVVAAPVVATLDVAGVISIDLAANTDPATEPAGSYYTVREDIAGQPQRTYRMIVPYNVGSPLDLAALADAYPSVFSGGGYGSGTYGTSGYGV